MGGPLSHTEVEIPGPRPQCDLCAMLGVPGVPAHYDGATIHGPWAYMCETHFESDGIGLGLGRGQRLIVTEDTPDL